MTETTRTIIVQLAGVGFVLPAAIVILGDYHWNKKRLSTIAAISLLVGLAAFYLA